MKQTAVEWLFDKMITEKHTISDWNDVVKQAKEMEKEQIVDAWKNAEGYNDLTNENLAEYYYNETYKGEEQ
jgi:hypothetical protein